MAKTKVKTISSKMFNNAIKNDEPGIVTVKWNGLDVAIKRRLNLSEAIKFVKASCMSCFDSDTGEYIPESLWLAKMSCAVALYTNISLSSDSSERYNQILDSGIMNVIFDNIDKHQFDMIMKCINAKVDDILRENANTLSKRFDNVLRIIESLQDNMVKMFEGVDNGDIKAVMSAVSDGGIDEKKIAQAYVEEMKK